MATFLYYCVNRLVFACLLVILIICILVVIDLEIVPYLFPQDTAIRIALADPDVKIAIANDQGNYKVVSVMPQGKNVISGFINISDTLVAVTLSMQGTMPLPDKYIAFVDMNQSRVVSSEWYSYRGGLPAFFRINLPQGATYYHALSSSIRDMDTSFGGGTGIDTFICGISNLSPENATVYPILVDEPNLWRILNGSSYEAAVYNDTNTHQPTVMNGTSPVYVGWNVNASFPLHITFINGAGTSFDNRYYIVFKNVGPDTVSMGICM